MAKTGWLLRVALVRLRLRSHVVAVVRSAVAVACTCRLVGTSLILRGSNLPLVWVYPEAGRIYLMLMLMLLLLGRRGAVLRLRGRPLIMLLRLLLLFLLLLTSMY